MSSKKKPSLFDIINQINLKKTSVPYSKSIVNGYMLLMWFSHASDCIDEVNRMNQYLFSMKDDQVYRFLWYRIPKKNRRLNYVKGPKKEKDPDLQSLMTKYNISKQEAQKFKPVL